MGFGCFFVVVVCEDFYCRLDPFRLWILMCEISRLSIHRDGQQKSIRVVRLQWFEFGLVFLLGPS